MDRGSHTAEKLHERYNVKKLPLNLNDQIQMKTMLPTPNQRDFRTGVPGRYEDPKRTKNVNDQMADVLPPNNGTKTGLKLQPAFVEWMMGYPEKWTELPYLDPNTALSD
jgi:hypothetical protein